MTGQDLLEVVRKRENLQEGREPVLKLLDDSPIGLLLDTKHRI